MRWWRGSERKAHLFLGPVNDGKEKGDKRRRQWILPLDRGGTPECRGMSLCPSPSIIQSPRKRGSAPAWNTASSAQHCSLIKQRELCGGVPLVDCGQSSGPLARTTRPVGLMDGVTHTQSLLPVGAEGGPSQQGMPRQVLTKPRG